MTNEKKKALKQVCELVKTYNLSFDEIKEQLTDTKNHSIQSTLLKTLLGYLGGIFVFSGLGLLLSLIWEDITSTQRVIATFGTGVVAFWLGVLALRDRRFEKTSTPFLLISALLQPCGMFFYLKEYIPSTDWQLAALMIYGIMLIQQSIAFWYIRRTTVLFLTISFWAVWLSALIDWLGFPREITLIITGMSIMLVSYAVDRAPHKSVTPFWYFCGGGLFLCGYWLLVEGSLYDLSYLLVNSFFVYLSLQLVSRSLLFVSVLGLITYLAYFTSKYFVDVIGWPIALIIMGFAMIALSSFAIKIGKDLTTRD